ncbi:MAG: LPS export ABC transporter periplasmic protein LptC [Gammaproteobacteria bacterium]|nr:LPS export ABC transporter periplasmic protein LptC [Gammaproteobacteria bacterium]
MFFILRRRTSILLIALIFAVIAFFTTESQLMTPDFDKIGGIHPSQTETPDTVITQLLSTTFDIDGQLKYTLSSPRLTLYPADDITHIDSPHVTLYQRDKPPWEIKSNQGTLKTNDLLLLLGDVQVKGQTGSEKAPLTMSTESLDLHTNEKYAETSEFVSIQTPRNSISALGMKANFLNSTIALLSQVKGKHEPRNN